jgi:hypothetical protein
MIRLIDSVMTTPQIDQGAQMAAKDTDEQKPETEENEHSLDMSQAAVKRMIADARERATSPMTS